MTKLTQDDVNRIVNSMLNEQHAQLFAGCSPAGQHVVHVLIHYRCGCAVGKWVVEQCSWCHSFFLSCKEHKPALCFWCDAKRAIAEAQHALDQKERLEREDK